MLEQRLIDIKFFFAIIYRLVKKPFKIAIYNYKNLKFSIDYKAKFIYKFEL